MQEKKQPRRGPGMRFQPGQSGNPKGKRKGCKHRVTLLAEQLMADDAESVVRKVIEAAKSGDMLAARLILDRIAPVRRGRPVTFSLPNDTRTADDVLNSLGAVVQSMSCGELTPEEASCVASVIEIKRRAIELAQTEALLAELEKEKEHQT
jgi:hypothetical protein